MCNEEKKFKTMGRNKRKFKKRKNKHPKRNQYRKEKEAKKTGANRGK